MPKFALSHKTPYSVLKRELGDELPNYQDRDYVLIGRGLVLHSTARRDYVCACGARLTTKPLLDPDRRGSWRTICTANEDHPQAEFLTRAAYDRRLAQGQLEAAEVWAGLPEATRQAIKNHKGG